MTRNTYNKILNAMLFLNLLAMIFTGVIIKWVLPPGTGGLHRHETAGEGWGRLMKEVFDPPPEVWGLRRHDWGQVHFYLAAAFITLLVLHLVLNWTWIRNCYFPRRRDSQAS